METHCHADPALWLLENPGFVSGANYRWFRDQFAPLEVRAAAQGGPSAYDLLNALAAQAPPGAEGLILLPCLMGAMTPTWNAAARGTFAGFTLAHRREHFARAVLEASAYAVRDIVDQMRQMGLALAELRMVGGGSRSRLWRQIKADVTGLPVTLPQTAETTALGAALLALVAIGAFANLSEAAARVVCIVETVEPEPAAQARYDDCYQFYRESYFAMLPVYERAARRGGQTMSGRLAQARAFLLDMDGTFFLGDRLIDGALGFIALLRRQGKNFLFLTNNSSKDRRQYVEKITRLGLPITPDQVLTSGEAAARLLTRDYAGAKLFVVGTASPGRGVSRRRLRDRRPTAGGGGGGLRHDSDVR